MTSMSHASGVRFHRTRPSAAARLFATFGAWRRRARERAELARLDDHVLGDIGLSRAEAEFIANKPFWRE